MSKDWTQEKAIETMEVEITALRAENERLRAALLEIVKPGGADGFWECVDIARAALEGK